MTGSDSFLDACKHFDVSRIDINFRISNDLQNSDFVKGVIGVESQISVLGSVSLELARAERVNDGLRDVVDVKTATGFGDADAKRPPEHDIRLGANDLNRSCAIVLASLEVCLSRSHVRIGVRPRNGQVKNLDEFAQVVKCIHVSDALYRLMSAVGRRLALLTASISTALTA